MNYPGAIRFLYDLRLFGAKFGLENTTRLAELAGNPHHRLRFIHVAGTNGKGSTCAMLESIYRTAGLRVGLFTSPHLVAFGERIQVNRHLIGEADIVRLVDLMRALTAQFAGGPPTFFEVVAVMALCYFEEQKCDLVLWETGLGGRLDATNIVTPLASVITNVQLDHEKWLGETLELIAAEKAGIIKPRVPVITGADEPGALRVITETASRNEASFHLVTREDLSRPPLDSVALPLLGEHQRFNAAVAAATVRVLREMIPVPDHTLRAGLEAVRWPGRLQVERLPGGQTVLFDGAHNPAGASTLRRVLDTDFATAEPTLILGVLRDKDWARMCELLSPAARRILLVPVTSERTATPDELTPHCQRSNPNAEVVSCVSMKDALDKARDAKLMVITGSLHLVGEAMELLRIQPSPSVPERELNDWTADSSANQRGGSAAV